MQEMKMRVLLERLRESESSLEETKQRLQDEKAVKNTVRLHL
jgi:hypothetical protein